MPKPTLKDIPPFARPKPKTLPARWTLADLLAFKGYRIGGEPEEPERKPAAAAAPVFGERVKHR